MRSRIRRYWGYRFSERHKVYSVQDMVHCDEHLLFRKGNPYWTNLRYVFRNYLFRGKLEKVISTKRTRAMYTLALKIIKMYFSMIVEDVLRGDIVHLSHANYIFIGNRRTSSRKFKLNGYKGIVYIPYIHMNISLFNAAKWKTYIFYLSKSNEFRLNGMIERGKRYKLNNE